MGIVQREKIKGPSAWVASDFERDTTWVHQLSGSAIEILDSALRTALV